MKQLATFKLLAFLITLPLAGLVQADSCEQNIDVVFALDSSGSVYDASYSNWQAELNLMQALLDEHDVASDKTNVSIINYSGCSSLHNYQTCVDNGGLVLELPLEGDAATVRAAVDALDNDDFIGSYSWVDDALYMAYNQLIQGAANKKVIVFFVEDQADDDHEACEVDSGGGFITYQSNTLQSLKALGTDIFPIVVKGDSNAEIDCIASGNGSVIAIGDSSLIDTYKAAITENSDGDEYCGLSDECPNDPFNDQDGDNLCADVDPDDDGDNVNDVDDDYPNDPSKSKKPQAPDTGASNSLLLLLLAAYLLLRRFGAFTKH